MNNNIPGESMRPDRDPRVVLFPPVRRLLDENRGLSRRLEAMTDNCRALEDEISILSDLLAPLVYDWRQSTGIADRTPGWWEILEWLVERYSSKRGDGGE